MKTALILIAIIASAAVAYSFRNKVTPEKKAAMIEATPKSFYDLSYTDINGKTISMADYKGKYVLCVNVASKCGKTPQYSELEALYEKHKALTYPRTDSQYLPEDYLPNAKAALQSLEAELAEILLAR